MKIPYAEALPTELEALVKRIIHSIKINMDRFLTPIKISGQPTKCCKKDCREKVEAYSRASRVGEATQQNTRYAKSQEPKKRLLDEANSRRPQP